MTANRTPAVVATATATDSADAAGHRAAAHAPGACALAERAAALRRRSSRPFRRRERRLTPWAESAARQCDALRQRTSSACNRCPIASPPIHMHGQRACTRAGFRPCPRSPVSACPCLHMSALACTCHCARGYATRTCTRTLPVCVTATCTAEPARCGHVFLFDQPPDNWSRPGLELDRLQISRYAYEDELKPNWQALDERTWWRIRRSPGHDQVRQSIIGASPLRVPPFAVS